MQLEMHSQGEFDISVRINKDMIFRIATDMVR